MNRDEAIAYLTRCEDLLAQVEREVTAHIEAIESPTEGKT